MSPNRTFNLAELSFAFGCFIYPPKSGLPLFPTLCLCKTDNFFLSHPLPNTLSTSYFPREKAKHNKNTLIRDNLTDVLARNSEEPNLQFLFLHKYSRSYFPKGKKNANTIQDRSLDSCATYINLVPYLCSSIDFKQ